MVDDQERKEPADQARRFRLGRKVKPAPIETREEREMRELQQVEEEEALRGSPEFERFTRKGCGGCLNITVLIFVIMIASIIGTCAARR